MRLVLILIPVISFRFHHKLVATGSARLVLPPLHIHLLLVKVKYLLYTAPHNDDDDDDDDNTGAVVGGVVGGICGAILIILVIILLWFYCVRKREQKISRASMQHVCTVCVFILKVHK